MADVIYPRLSSIVKISDLPKELSFIQDGLDQILNGLFFRNFKFYKSFDGVQRSYIVDQFKFSKEVLENSN